MKTLWSAFRIGIIYSVACVAVAVVYTSFFGPISFGPMFGEWGWLHIGVALLMLGVLILLAVDALDRQPNPYGRTHPMYDLKDVPEHTSFGTGRFAWVTQLLPLMLTIALLFAVAQFI